MNWGGGSTPRTIPTLHRSLYLDLLAYLLMSRLTVRRNRRSLKPPTKTLVVSNCRRVELESLPCRTAELFTNCMNYLCILYFTVLCVCLMVLRFDAVEGDCV